MAFATRVKEGGDFKPFPRGFKDGVNRRRVLPGIHTCGETGDWAKKYATHTYKVPRADDPEKFDYHTFHCVEVIDWVNREKVVLETCPECVLIKDKDDDFKALQVKLKEELKSGHRTKDEVRKLLKPLIEWKKRHGRSFWWAVNSKDADGKYATEKWPNDVKKQFDALKKKLKDEDDIGAILPLDQGIWVDIKKTPGNETGTGFPEYDVQPVMEKLEGGLKRLKLAPLAESEADEAEKTCWDLNDPGVITLSRDQVKRLATSGDAPEVLRAVFEESTKAKKAATPAPAAKTEAAPAAKAETKTETPPAASPAAKSPPKEETEDERIIREANEAIAAAQARRAQNRKEAITPDPTPAKTETKPETAPAYEVESKPEAKTTPAAKTGGDDDADLDAFMKEYDLGDGA